MMWLLHIYNQHHGWTVPTRVFSATPLALLSVRSLNAWVAVRVRLGTRPKIDCNVRSQQVYDALLFNWKVKIDFSTLHGTPSHLLPTWRHDHYVSAKALPFCAEKMRFEPQPMVRCVTKTLRFRLSMGNFTFVPEAMVVVLYQTALFPLSNFSVNIVHTIYLCDTHYNCRRRWKSAYAHESWVRSLFNTVLYHFIHRSKSVESLRKGVA